MHKCIQFSNFDVCENEHDTWNSRRESGESTQKFLEARIHSPPLRPYQLFNAVPLTNLSRTLSRSPLCQLWPRSSRMKPNILIAGNSNPLLHTAENFARTSTHYLSGICRHIHLYKQYQFLQSVSIKSHLYFQSAKLINVAE